MVDSLADCRAAKSDCCCCCCCWSAYMGPSDTRRIGDVTDGPAPAAGEEPNPPADVVLDRGVLAAPLESWSLNGAGPGSCGAAAAGGAMEALCGRCIGGDCM